MCVNRGEAGEAAPVEEEWGIRTRPWSSGGGTRRPLLFHSSQKDTLPRGPCSFLSLWNPGGGSSGFALPSPRGGKERSPLTNPGVWTCPSPPWSQDPLIMCRQRNRSKGKKQGKEDRKGRGKRQEEQHSYSGTRPSRYTLGTSALSSGTRATNCCVQEHQSPCAVALRSRGVHTGRRTKVSSWCGAGPSTSPSPLPGLRTEAVDGLLAGRWENEMRCRL